MPGRHLNDCERRLAQFWARPTGTHSPMLRQVTVGSEGRGSGLRGIQGIYVPFNYPVTALCGKNGVGKTTILALAALAYHSPDDWSVYRGRLDHRHRDGPPSHYTFKDFFCTGYGEASPRDVRIRWDHWSQTQGEFSQEITKTGANWMRYARRPIRQVSFVPVSRVLPTAEISAARKEFSKAVAAPTVNALDANFRDRMSNILSKQFAAADLRQAKRHSLQSCTSGVNYTGFNMGGGEACVLEILLAAQQLPREGLLIIEEVDLSLHPEAQKRLAQNLLEIADQKRLQIICSTHSETFIDALPRQARLLLRKQGDDHDIIESPSTRFALHEVEGGIHPELQIYCEDEFAAALIREALPTLSRPRVNVVSVGSNTTLARQAAAHMRAGLNIAALSIFDADCTDADIQTWMRRESGGGEPPSYLRLPGEGSNPEAWILQELEHDAYADRLAEHLGCTRAAVAEHVNAMGVEQDPHDIVYRLSERTGFSREICTQKLAESVASIHPQFDPLRDCVNGILEG